MYLYMCERIFGIMWSRLLTATTASLATIAKISEQETIPGHTFSKAALESSMMPNPRRLRLGTAFFSACLFDSSNKTDPSHPYIDDNLLIRPLIIYEYNTQSLYKESHVVKKMWANKSND